MRSCGGTSGQFSNEGSDEYLEKISWGYLERFPGGTFKEFL